MYKYCSEYLLDRTFNQRIHTRIRISYSERVLISKPPKIQLATSTTLKRSFVGRIAETLPILHNLFSIGYVPGWTLISALQYGRHPTTTPADSMTGPTPTELDTVPSASTPVELRLRTLSSTSHNIQHCIIDQWLR